MSQVFLVRLRVNVNEHCPELQTPEPLAHVTDTFLQEQNRAGGNTANQKSYKQRQRNQQRRDQHDENGIESALPAQCLMMVS